MLISTFLNSCIYLFIHLYICTLITFVFLWFLHALCFYVFVFLCVNEVGGSNFTLSLLSIHFLSSSGVTHYGRDPHGEVPEVSWPCCWLLCLCLGWLGGCTCPLLTVTSQKHWSARVSWSLRSPESTVSSALKTIRTTNAIQVRLWIEFWIVSGSLDS